MPRVREMGESDRALLAQEDLQEEAERRSSRVRGRRKDGKWRGGIRQDGDRMGGEKGGKEILVNPRRQNGRGGWEGGVWQVG